MFTREDNDKIENPISKRKQKIYENRPIKISLDDEAQLMNSIRQLINNTSQK